MSEKGLLAFYVQFSEEIGMAKIVSKNKPSAQLYGFVLKLSFRMKKKGSNPLWSTVPLEVKNYTVTY